jgi:hypothetical protein
MNRKTHAVGVLIALVSVMGCSSSANEPPIASEPIIESTPVASEPPAVSEASSTSTPQSVDTQPAVETQEQPAPVRRFSFDDLQTGLDLPTTGSADASAFLFANDGQTEVPEEIADGGGVIVRSDQDDFDFLILLRGEPWCFTVPSILAETDGSEGTVVVVPADIDRNEIGCDDIQLDLVIGLNVGIQVESLRLVDPTTVD